VHPFLHPFCVWTQLDFRKRREETLSHKALKIKHMDVVWRTEPTMLKLSETVKSYVPKLKVAGSNPVSRSKKIKDLAKIG
jgi:hypothetical protein